MMNVFRDARVHAFDWHQIRRHVLRETKGHPLDGIGLVSSRRLDRRVVKIVTGKVFRRVVAKIGQSICRPLGMKLNAVGEDPVGESLDAAFLALRQEAGIGGKF